METKSPLPCSGDHSEEL